MKNSAKVKNKILITICCIMLLLSGCSGSTNIRDNKKSSNKTIEKFKGLWLSDSEENDVLINSEGKLLRGMAYGGDFDFEGNVIKCIVGKNKILAGKGIYFEIKDGKLNRYENDVIVNTYSLGESLDNISTKFHYINSEESLWNDAEFNYEDLTTENTGEQTDGAYNEDDSYVEDDISYDSVYDIQNRYLNAIKDYSASELMDISPNKNIENIEYSESENSVQKELNDFKKIIEKLYGNNVEISFEQSSFEEFSVQMLNNAMNDEEDVDIIEGLNKTMKDVIETGCNLQRCIKSDMTFKMSGEKGEDTQTVSSYIYEVDDSYYIDTYAFSDLYAGQEKALEEKKNGDSDYSTANQKPRGLDQDEYASLLLR